MSRETINTLKRWLGKTSALIRNSPDLSNLSSRDRHLYRMVAWEDPKPPKRRSCFRDRSFSVTPGPGRRTQRCLSRSLILESIHSWISSSTQATALAPRGTGLGKIPPAIPL